MERKTLLLAPWYFPIRVIRWQDAVKMIYEGSVDVIIEYGETICSPSVVWNTPAVIRLQKLPYLYKKGARFSRLNVYSRDNFSCQYCGNKFPWKDLSFDHVFPRSSGGRTEWLNIVTACKKCNCRKGDRTCDESGMWPINDPVVPRINPANSLIGLGQESPPKEWEPFLYSK